MQPQSANTGEQYCFPNFRQAVVKRWWFFFGNQNLHCDSWTLPTYPRIPPAPKAHIALHASDTKGDNISPRLSCRNIWQAPPEPHGKL